MSVILNLPWWLVPVCLLAAAVPAYFLYRHSFYERENKKLAWLLMGLRFIAFFFLAFLLLEPLIKTTFTRTEKPIVVVLADNSFSVGMVKDSVQLRKELPAKVNSLVENLQDKFETGAFRFGSSFKEGTDTLLFNEKLTDISGALEEVYTRFYNRNLGAVVLISDGIYNKGFNPLGSIKKFRNVSFYTVGLGDTIMTKDLVMADVLYNKTAYLGNDYPVEAVVQARKMQGTKAVLVVKDNGKEVSRRELQVQTNNQTIRTSFLLHAGTEGVHKISAEIVPVADEFSVKNNGMSVYVNVIRNRQKVLVLAAAPHPDVAALKYAMETSQNYHVTSAVYQQGASYNFNQYNLVVVHALPLTPADEEVVDRIRKAGVPILFVMTQNTNKATLSKLAGVLNVSGTSANATNAAPQLNTHFTSFTISDKTRSMIAKFPPLAAPFGEYKMSPGANVLFYQRIGSVNSPNPLVVFNKESTAGKTGIICGEGIWMWKMRDFELNQNNEAFNEIVQKTVQYLSITENKSNFRVLHKNEFPENEPVVFDAELFNENYEPVTSSEVHMVITNSEGKKFPGEFSVLGNMYRYSTGLPPGEYTYSANTTYGKKEYNRSGRFQVTAVNTELLRTEADHRLLYQMAHDTKGKFYGLGQMDELLKDLEGNENVKATIYEEKSLDDLINIRWLIMIPVLLLGLEWFLRKRAGGY